MRRASSTTLVFVAVASVTAAFLAVAAPLTLVFGVVTQALLVLPGILLVRALAPSSGWLAAVTFGPLLGQAFGSLLLTMLWVAGGRGAWLFVAAPAMVGLLLPAARRLTGRLRLPVTDKGDGVALAVLALLVVLVVGFPFAHVGDVTPAGQAYRAYFTADYVWRRAVVIELAKGTVLPINPYFHGDVLHYYWMPHTLSAVQYRFAGAWASLDELLLIRSLAVDLFFAGFLFGMVRLFGVRPWPAAGGVAFVILSTSLEGLYVLFDHTAKGLPLESLRNLNIDAISRWYFQGIPIDGLQRLLMYQPHHIVGYCIGLMGLLAIGFRTRRVDPVVFAVAGGCLSLSIVISSFAGLMVTTAAMVYEGAGVLRSRDWRRGVRHALAAAIPLTLGVAAVYALGYVDQSGAVLEVGVNRVAVHRVLWVTWLSMGPVLAVGILAIPALRDRPADLAILAALAITSIGFYFFVNVRDHQDVYVGWRVGHFLFMAAAVIVGRLLTWLASSQSAMQPLHMVGLVVALFAGLPTTVIDIYNTQDISEHGEAPYWTMMLRPDELRAFEWIKANTPDAAVFQVDPLARATDSWAYLPAFAERRMAVGLPISMVPLAKYEQGSANINSIFSEPPLSAYEHARRSHVDYVLIGPHERNAHPGVEERFDSIPTLMPLAYKNPLIAIYQVAR